MKILLQVSAIILSFSLTSCVESTAPQEPVIPEGTYNPPLTGGDDDVTTPDESQESAELPPVVTTAIGSPMTFEVATWNIEEFPKQGKTVDSVASVLKEWELDVVAVQEVQSAGELANLASKVPGFNSLISDLGDRMFRMGLLYNTNEVEILSQKDLFPNDRFAFPRPPLQVNMKIKRTDELVTLISIHLKAFSGSQNQYSRKTANTMLKEYINGLAKENPDVKVILLGDFNSQLDTEEMEPWLSESSVELATSDLFDKNVHSYISSTRRSLIDHIVTRKFSLDEVLIPRPYENQKQYEDLISDHLPVVGIAY